jgi:hypothetical protein
MNSLRLHLLCALTTALGVQLAAQQPENPPPWWGVHDEVTVSLYWDFSGPTPFVPLEVAVPTWYNNPVVVTQAIPTGPLSILPSLNGHTDVLALTGNGTNRQARLAVKVDNDPHYDWVKIFWIEVDEFAGASGSVVEALEKDLAKYKRSSMTTKSTAIGGGWNRVTITAQLVPQPDDEAISFSFFETALGNAAIDNLYINSKCVKVDDTDQDGDAMGQPEGFSVDLTAATGGQQCLAAAVTEGPGPGFVRSYWISALATLPGSTHQVFRLNQAGIPTSVTQLPDTLLTAPNGASDLAVETVVSSTGTTVAQYVYALVDLRSTGTNLVILRAIDTTGTLVPARNVTITNFPPVSPQRFGLAFNPSGNQGLGTFLITAPQPGAANGLAFEFDRAGNLLRTVNNLPLGVVGAGYDDVFGNYYWFSNEPRQTPSGQIQVNGSEVSGYDFQPTGVSFFGNLQLPNPSGPRGGVASGLEVYRRGTGEFRAACVVQLTTPARSMLYELKGPFRWGQSLLGTCGMRGLPFEGSNNFQVTLSGVPNGTFAVLYAGFGARTTPIPLAPYGLDESLALINLDLWSALQAPIAPGEFAFTMPLPPPGVGFSYVPMFFQWLVFDPSLPAGIATSPGGKTLIY